MDVQTVVPQPEVPAVPPRASLLRSKISKAAGLAPSAKPWSYESL